MLRLNQRQAESFEVNVTRQYRLTIKRVAACLLLVAFFLPLSQCIYEPPATLSSIEMTAVPELKVNSETSANAQDKAVYAYQEIDDVESAFIVCAAFFWPAMLTGVLLIWSALNPKWIIPLLEAVLCVGSTFVLIVLALAEGNPRYGAYVAIASISAYFVTTINELASVSRETPSKRTKISLSFVAALLAGVMVSLIAFFVIWMVAPRWLPDDDDAWIWILSAISGVSIPVFLYLFFALKKEAPSGGGAGSVGMQPH